MIDNASFCSTSTICKDMYFDELIRMIKRAHHMRHIIHDFRTFRKLWSSLRVLGSSSKDRGFVPRPWLDFNLYYDNYLQRLWMSWPQWIELFEVVVKEYSDVKTVALPISWYFSSFNSNKDIQQTTILCYSYQ